MNTFVDEYFLFCLECFMSHVGYKLCKIMTAKKNWILKSKFAKKRINYDAIQQVLRYHFKQLHSYFQKKIWYLKNSRPILRRKKWNLSKPSSQFTNFSISLSIKSNNTASTKNSFNFISINKNADMYHVIWNWVLYILWD